MNNEAAVTIYKKLHQQIFAAGFAFERVVVAEN